ncbi:MAG: electron transport complex subunit RsxC [Planctomycetota bacterium]|jgi:electron transport complex protein RnfC
MAAWFRMPSFPNGVHPDENKERTENLPIERMPFVDTYVLPLGQHIGAPAKPIVKVGEHVVRGQMVAEPGGFVSTSYHSPVTGKVVAIADRRHPIGNLVPAIEIKADPFATQRFEPQPAIDWRALEQKEFVAHVQRSGMVGLGGAAFPSHVKYAVPDGIHIDRFILNGCECEPYLTCDHRLMAEQPLAVLRGTEMVATRLGAKGSNIGVEANKPDAVEALRAAIRNGHAIDHPIEVNPLQVKYPQGAEKMLIKAIFDVEVPPGKFPLDVGMVVNNVGTMAAIADYFDTGLPLIERVVTVSGPGVKKAANLMVPIGTPIREVLRYCGGLTDDTREVIMGGPMMGFAVADLDAPILKGTSGILAFTEAEAKKPSEHTCIRCARCLEACPVFLNPARLGKLSRHGRFQEALEDYHLMDCMECGACSFACPSGIPLVQLFRVAKSALAKSARQEAAEKKAAEQKEAEQKDAEEKVTTK